MKEDETLMFRLFRYCWFFAVVVGMVSTSFQQQQQQETLVKPSTNIDRLFHIWLQNRHFLGVTQ